MMSAVEQHADEMSAMNTAFDPLVSEFETSEQESAHTAWLRAEMERSIADPRPKIPHDEVMRRLDERIHQWQEVARVAA